MFSLVVPRSWLRRHPCDICGQKTPREIVLREIEPYSSMDGYYDMPEVTVRVFRNLWHSTEDFGNRDERGFFCCADRDDDQGNKTGNSCKYMVNG
jgi:acyl-CoA synthetase (AMP-forming)/AMP-acid ligase II